MACMTSIVSLCSTSCVNEAYDLSKGIDTSIDINADISVPFGSTQKILIGDLLEIDSGNSMITVADNGDYVISMDGSMDPQTIAMPEIDIDGINIGNAENDGGFMVRMEVPVDDLRNELPVGDISVPDNYTFDDISVNGETSTDISISQKVDYVTAIESIDMDADLTLSLALARSGGNGTGGSITISEGFVLDFPDYIVVGTPSDSRFELDPDGNSIKTVSEVTLEMNKPLTVSLDITAIDFTEMPVGQGFVDGYIVIDDKIVMSGLKVSARARSFGSTVDDLPTELSLDIDLGIDVAAVRSVRLMIDPEVTVEDQTIELTGERPEFLEGADVNIDLYNPVITLTVRNDSPLSAALSATITANTEGKDPVSVMLGSQDPDAEDAIVLSPGVTPVYISRKPYDPGDIIPGTNGYIPVVKDEIGKLVSALPDEIVISGIKVQTVQEMMDMELDGSREYTFAMDYSIYSPMAFGEDLLIEYPYDIKGLNDTFNSSSEETGSGNDGVEIRFTEATVSLTFVNEIPFRLGVTALPIDTDGNVIESGIEISLTDPATGADVSVAPGSINNPGSTSALITVHADMETVRKLDGFRLDLKGSCDSGFAGQAINKDQGIQLKDISVSIVGGISTEL